MKVTVFHIKSEVPKKYYKFYDKFIKFLQKNYPLKKDTNILFLHDRVGKMSTGADTDDHVLKVLTTNRLNRDILRTLAHELQHVKQDQDKRIRVHSPPGSKIEQESKDSNDVNECKDFHSLSSPLD